MTLAMPTTRFHRPPGSDAIEPPEAHGIARDAVKLLVARPGGVSHARFADLGDLPATGRSPGGEQLRHHARRG